MKRLLLAFAAVLLGLAATLAGAAGGVGTGGTGSFGRGSITGFSSVIVSGVRYDDSKAVVTDADGHVRSAADLRLGMSVDVTGGPVAGGVGVASKIRFAADLSGVPAAVDAATGRLALLWQTVQVDAGTAFDESLAGGLAAVAPGQRLEVHAQWDAAAQRYRAARIEPSSSRGNFRVRGTVVALDVAARAARIGSGVFTWNGALPKGLALGQFVDLQVQSAPPASPSWTIVGSASAPQPADGSQGFVAGLVGDFASTASFTVDGIAVDASAAAFPDGVAIGPGTRVQVQGRSAAGVLRADRVAILSDDSPERDFVVGGAVSAVTDPGSAFRVRGVAVDAAEAELVGGAAQDLRPGAKVRVRGHLSADGTRLHATRVEFSR